MQIKIVIEYDTAAKEFKITGNPDIVATLGILEYAKALLIKQALVDVKPNPSSLYLPKVP